MHGNRTGRKAAIIGVPTSIEWSGRVAPTRISDAAVSVRPIRKRGRNAAGATSRAISRDGETTGSDYRETLLPRVPRCEITGPRCRAENPSTGRPITLIRGGNLHRDAKA